MITSEDAMKIRDKVIKLRRNVRGLHKEASEGMVHQIDDRIYDLIEEISEIKKIIEQTDK